jgi:hypothetical protein
MALSTKNVPHILVDGKWFPCGPAGEFGYLGDRIFFDLASSGGHPPKKLLIRKCRWPQGKRVVECVLEIDKLSPTVGLGLRPVVPKTYQCSTPAPDRTLKREEDQFFQQEITGLITLRAAILKVVAEGSPRKVWHLFYSACKALNCLGTSIGNSRLVPLQCPNSLAVDVQTGQVVLLDAELKIPPLADSHEAVFLKWFGSAGKARYAQESTASVLHSKALLLFFREVFGYLQKQEGTAGGPAKLLGTQLDSLANAGSLLELEKKAEAVAEDWSISSDEMPESFPSGDASKNRLAAGQEEKTFVAWLVC